MEAKKIAQLMYNASLILNAIDTHEDFQWEGIEAERDHLNDAITRETMGLLNGTVTPGSARQMTIEEILPEEPEEKPVIMADIPEIKESVKPAVIKKSKKARFDPSGTCVTAAKNVLAKIGKGTAVEILQKARSMYAEDLEGIADEYFKAKIRNYAYKGTVFGMERKEVPEPEWKFGHTYVVVFYLLDQWKPQQQTKTSQPEIVKLNGRPVTATTANRNGRPA